ncbi:hypothetical protein F5X96DRAFT_675263 [Biscogniauxia mediterranea]|nr:hypothetical protein F5X96DRAFT_675263 [Biscogniauxia mediterranea]
MSQYYGESQWPGANPAAAAAAAAAASAPPSTWDHQTPPPARSGECDYKTHQETLRATSIDQVATGANSAIPREESAAFLHQIEGKRFFWFPRLSNGSRTHFYHHLKRDMIYLVWVLTGIGGTEVERAIDNLVKSGKMFGPLGRHGRVGSGPGPRPHPVEFGDPRTGGHPGPNLQNFYAAQRHQSSRGSNEAEQMMQAKRRMAAQRERELRNYHQEQQYNRNVLADMTYNGKADRALSPGSMSEDERRELIARQRSALYGEASFEDGASRAGAPGLPPTTTPGGPQTGEGSAQSRSNSNASPQSNPPTNIGMFENAVSQQASRTSNSSPTSGSPPRVGGAAKSGQAGNTVAPIGTRPSGVTQATNPALSKRSTTPLPSPLSHGFSASSNNDENGQGISTSGAPSNPASASADGYNGWGGRSGVWGNKSNLGVQASVWG